MNQVIAKWEQSYHFEDEELADLLDLQSSLTTALSPIAKKTETHPAEADETRATINSYMDLACAEELTKTNPAHQEPGALQNLRKVALMASANHDRLESLLLLLGELREAHLQVRSLSASMQSVWDGILSQQVTFEELASRIESKLEVFTSGFAKIEANLNISDPLMDPLKPEFQEALQQAMLNYQLVGSKPDYKEASIHLFRYKQLLAAGLGACKTLFDRRMAELILAGREQSSPIDWQELSQRYHQTSNDLHNIMILINEASKVDNAYAQMLHDCLSRYLASRYELAKRSRFVVEIGSLEAPQLILAGCIELLAEEKTLFEHTFGGSEDLQRHYQYFGEQLIKVIGAKLKGYIDAISPEDRSSFSTWLAGQRKSCWKPDLLPPFALELLSQAAINEPSSENL